MDDVSEYDKTNYTIIPIGQENGKTIYIRIPQDEAGRFIGGVFWKALNKFNPDNNKSLTRDLSEVLSFMGGQIPSQTPIITTPIAITDYLLGNNPYDKFRSRHVLTDKQFKAGGSEAHKAMGKYVFQQLGGGLFYRFDTGRPREIGLVEKIVNLPILSNILGRFFRVSNYGETEKLREIQANVQQKEARQSLAEGDAVDKAVLAAIKADADTRAKQKPFQDQILINVFGKVNVDQIDIPRANRLMKNFRLTLLRGTSDPAIGVLVSATTNAQKIAIMRELRATMPFEEYKAFTIAAVNERVISVDVANYVSK